MYPEQSVTNIVAHGGSSAEMSKWYDSGQDADDLMAPTRFVFERARKREFEASHRPVSAQVAQRAAEQAVRTVATLENA